MGFLDKINYSMIVNSGFHATGLLPLDHSKINNVAFLPSQTTERQLLSTIQSTTTDNSISRQHQLATNTCEEQTYDTVDLLTAMSF